ncbi:MAG: ribbon-helix-helix protein, CopG family, partial [Chloroflexi bacterium]|nr:ribbon-helix-helix protein, CopG family [Chloroflexota bacterium]
MQCTIELDELRLRALEQFAAAERRSVEDLVRQAIDNYLAQRERDRPELRARLESVVAAFREGVPPDATPEEIEAEITAARAEYRAERTARRAKTDLSSPDAG